MTKNKRILISLFLILIPISILNSQIDSKLKYIEFNEIGNPADVLNVKEERSRPLKSSEVRVRVLAVPIHPSDLLQISGNYGVEPILPFTPGKEGIGRVLETSSEVRHLKVGEIWEIDNTMQHAVRNNSEESRVHLIIDYLEDTNEIVV